MWLLDFDRGGLRGNNDVWDRENDKACMIATLTEVGITDKRTDAIPAWARPHSAPVVS